VLALSNGDGAIETIARTGPDLIILDVWLENPDAGWRVLERLQSRATTVAIPVIICATATERLEFERSRLLACRLRIIEKPFDGDALLAALQEALVAVGKPAAAS
jgi:CheY-like chemotaxis protein